MKKNEFLDELRSKLDCLSDESVDRWLDYYAEMIDDRIEDGESEEAAVAAMGTLDDIIDKIINETPLPELVKKRVTPSRKLKAWEIVLLILGSPVWVPLALAALVIVLALYIVIWSVVAVLYSVDLAFAAVAVAGIFSCVIIAVNSGIAAGAVFFGLGLLAAGLAIFTFFGSTAAAKGILWTIRKAFIAIKHCFVKKDTKEAVK